MIKSKKQMYLVIGAFALVMLLGTVTYAFFNYTRTGSANIIRTGRIAFNSEQGTAMNLDNLFPIDTTVSGIMNDATKVGTVTINVTGDTEYSEGIEYLVTATNVSNTVGSGANAKSLPISIDVSVTNNTNNDPVTTLGTEDNDYFTNRGPSASTSIYKVLAGDTITNNEQLLVGYIKQGATGVDGNIVIKAYIDKEKVAITDTYPEGTVRTVKTTGYTAAACETATGLAEGAAICASASALQTELDSGSTLTPAQIRALVVAGLVEEYTDGTTSEWVGDRERFTTTEWNSLQASGVSFQVKVEAQEGTWVTGPVPTIDSCPGCKYMYTRSIYYYGGASNVNATAIEDIPAGVIKRNYNDVISASGENYFLGFTETQDGKIDRAYACGIKGEAPNEGTAFCIEGSLEDGHGGDSTTRAAVYSANSVILNDSTTGIWEGNCTSSTDIFGTGYVMRCGGTIKVQTDTSGNASVFSGSSVGDGNCEIFSYGGFGCGKID